MLLLLLLLMMMMTMSLPGLAVVAQCRDQAVKQLLLSRPAPSP